MSFLVPPFCETTAFGAVIELSVALVLPGLRGRGGFELKINPLKKNHIFSKAYKKGKKALRRTVCVYCLSNPKPRSGPCMGITVSTKLGGAVSRNRAKRIIRAGYAAVLNERPLQNRFIVIVARSCCYDGSTKSTDVYRDLTEAFGELGIFAEAGQ